MLIIADPSAWASSQGYQLHPIQSNNFSVTFGDKSLGAIVPVAGGYRFVTECSTPAADKEYDSNLSHSHVSQSFGICGLTPIEGMQFDSGKNQIALPSTLSGTGQQEHISDCNYWLPYAAEHYHLSRNIRDYVLVPIPAIFSGMPNTNGDALSIAQMLRFDPDIGLQMYKTFKGKGTYLEHANRDKTQAKGVILDAFLRPVPFNSKYYKIVLLLAYDRTKDPVLAQQILSRKTNAYSVGFMYSSYSCSICKLVTGRGISLRTCEHTELNRPTYQQADGRIVFRNCENAVGFECSAVQSPAFVSAIGPHLLDVRSF